MKEDFSKFDINKKIDELCIIGRFVSGDYTEMKIELSKNSKEWSWNFKDNIITIPEKDLKKRSIEELKFLIGHEGSHRKITGGKLINLKNQEQGLPILINSIEDPRVNNYLISNFPNFKRGVDKVYSEMFAKMISDSKKDLGMIPKSIQATFGYIQQWFKEINKQDCDLSEINDEDVKKCLEKTIKKAQDTWWSYPSLNEAEDQDRIDQYSNFVFDNILGHIWPEYKKLIKQDQKHQESKKLLDEMGKKTQSDANNSKSTSQSEEWEKKEKSSDDGEKSGNSQNSSTPPSSNNNLLKDKFKETLSDSEEKELEEFLGNYNNSNSEENGDGSPNKNSNIYDDLSDKLKRKLEGFKKSLSKEEKDKLSKKAKKTLKEFDKKFSSELEGKFQKSIKEELKKKVGNDEKSDREKRKSIIKEFSNPKKKNTPSDKNSVDDHLLKKINAKNKEIFEKDNTEYRETLNKIYPLVNNLEQQLKFILREKQRTKKLGGFRSGGSLKISRVIAARAGNVPINEWKVFEKKKKPDKKDYVFSLLVDLSESMEGENIKIIGLGLGDDTEHVQEYFSESLANIKVEDIPKELAILLKKILKN